MYDGRKKHSFGNFEQNPCGNLWLKDKKNIGHKLMYKMGWAEGKGLGKNEDGMSKVLSPRIRNGNQGIGWSHLGLMSFEYDAILENLNKTFKTTAPEKKKATKSLEVRCNEFKNRMHYQKFVRGKDASRYSEKDIASIFVQKTAKDNQVIPLVKDNQNLCTRQLSIPEYFASKIKSSEKSNSTIVKDTKTLVKRSSGKKRNFESTQNFENGKRIKLGNIDTNESASMNVFQQKQCNSNDESTCELNLERRKENKFKSYFKKSALKTTKDEVSSICTHVSKTSFEDKVIEEQLENQIIKKKNKKSKTLSVLNTLKCCLKTSLNYISSHTHKQVSFNANVSLRTIENCLVEDEHIFCDDSIVTAQLNDIVKTDVEDSGDCGIDFENSKEQRYSKATELSFLNVNKTEDNRAFINEKEFKSKVNFKGLHENENISKIPTTTVVPKCPDLPKSTSSHYNSWLESQRQAARMQLYRNMIEKWKKHSVLETTNLTDIKGYGNWGY